MSHQPINRRRVHLEVCGYFVHRQHFAQSLHAVQLFWKPHFASGAPIPSSTTISAAIRHSAILDRWYQCSVSHSLAQFLDLVP
jgi:hypothetical protein